MMSLKPTFLTDKPALFWTRLFKTRYNSTAEKTLATVVLKACSQGLISTLQTDLVDASMCQISPGHCKTTVHINCLTCSHSIFITEGHSCQNVSETILTWFVQWLWKRVVKKGKRNSAACLQSTVRSPSTKVILCLMLGSPLHIYEFLHMLVRSICLIETNTFVPLLWRLLTGNFSEQLSTSTSFKYNRTIHIFYLDFKERCCVTVGTDMQDHTSTYSLKHS